MAREDLRKEILAQLKESFEAQVQQQVDSRLRENLLDWEDDYKQRYVSILRDQVAEELRSEFEFSV